MIKPGSLVYTLGNKNPALVLKIKEGECLVWYTRNYKGESWNEKLWIYTKWLCEVNKPND
jgi:predicted RNA-binding protein